MLVLARKIGGKIIMETSDGPIEVTVVRVKGRTIRLGVTAPQTVRIKRDELPDLPKHTEGEPRDDSDASDAGDAARRLDSTVPTAED